MKIWKHSAMALVAAMFAAGCAQDVGDIDRTQPDYLVKADFDGVWYTRQTVTDVPGTVGLAFVGVASGMEKIRWEITKDALIAYRAYEEIPGYDEKAGGFVDGQTVYADGQGQGIDPEAYKEAPIAAYPITSHFDIQRSYSASTGEQTNVISENASDRDWNERKYMRVDWGHNMITATFPDFITAYSDFSRWITENEGEADSLYEERDGDGTLRYFDFTTRMASGGADDMEIRSSFYRLEELQRDYEPAFYTDEMMTKFGYFRTERFIYRRDVGFTDSGRIYLANRHDMWLNDYRRNPETGEYLRDADGRRLPTPMAEREPKKIVYYLSPNFPEEILPGAQGVADDWNRAFTRAVAAAKGIAPEDATQQFGNIFVLCQNPVTEDDDPACDPRSPELKEAQENAPYEARAGDVRKSFIYWVHQPQAAGPLGYGPSYADPETGELISGTAYVYGAGVDAVAGGGVDIVRMVNGDFTEEQLRNGDDRLARILETRRHDIDPRGEMSGEMLDNIPDTKFDTPQDLLDPRLVEKLERIQENGLEPLENRLGKTDAAMQAIKDAGLDRLLLDDEYIRGMSDGQLDPSKVTPEELELLLQTSNPLDMHQKAHEHNERLIELSKHTVYMQEFADEAVMGTALEYKGETDYDKIWNDLRNKVFRAVMAHEVGHTIGLRHNFQGSWDSVNYFDEYWDLRKENFAMPDSVQDFYEINALTDKQAEGDMTRYQYSTIMDYHSRFNSDFSGIGKYDEAAVLFAYTFGTYDEIAEDNDEPIVADPGFVEVFTNVPEVVEIPGFQPIETRPLLHSYDYRYAASQHPLEDFHYTTLVSLMGGPEVLRQRDLVHYKDLKAQIEAEDEDRPLEVQYMFCSDEWAGATISCDRWDLGADPFEKVQWAIKGYNEYYPLTHFRRDRLTFGVNSVLNRAARAFTTMPNVYQRWYFNQFYSSDQTLSTYFTLAAYSGFNFLLRQLATPNYGAYQFDEDSDMYRLVSYDPDYEGAELRIDYGEGKALFSDYADDGYYFFTRILSVGNYWEKIIAMQILAATTSTFVLGADTAADFRTYLLPYYLAFDEELTSVFNGMYLSDYDVVAPFAGLDGVRMPTFAPLYVDGEAIDPLSGQYLPPEGSQKKIRTSINFTQRINAMIYGVALFSSAYSPAYIDQARVWRLGSGTGVTTREDLCRQQGLGEECTNGIHELITYTDLNSGIPYAAIRDTTVNDESLAVQMIEEGAFWEELYHDERLSEADRRQVKRILADHTEDVLILLEAVDALGSVLF